MKLRGPGHCGDNDLIFKYKTGQRWTPLLRHMIVGVLRDQIFLSHLEILFRSEMALVNISKLTCVQ